MGVYVNLALPNVSAAPDMVITKDDQALIERGAYLANHVAVCIDCHSTRDWEKFSGPIVHGTEGKGGEVFDEKLGLPELSIPKILPLMDFLPGMTVKYIGLSPQGLPRKGNQFSPLCPIAGITKWILKM